MLYEGKGLSSNRGGIGNNNGMDGGQEIGGRDF